MFYGSITALITPFDDEGQLDIECFKKLIGRQIDAGSDGIVVCGTTGESPTLSQDEKDALLLTAVKEVAGRIPVIMGTGCNCTRSTVERTKRAKKLGADGALVIVPYYNKPSEEGCIRHFEEVSKEGFPIIAYHHPGRTGVELSLKALLAIGSMQGVEAIKEVSSCIELIDRSSCPILIGDDLIAHEMLKGGAAGTISVMGNAYPKEWKEQPRLLKHLAEAVGVAVNPVGIKTLMQLMRLSGDNVRLPLVRATEAVRNLIASRVELKVYL